MLQPVDVTTLALGLLSLALVVKILVSLARAVRASGDEVSLLLALGFALVGASVAVSLGSSALRDVFLIASAHAFSTYLSVAGYSVMLLPRKLPAGSPLLILSAALAAGEALGAAVAFLLGLGSRSAPASAGFVLLGISHVLRTLLNGSAVTVEGIRTGSMSHMMGGMMGAGRGHHMEACEEMMASPHVVVVRIHGNGFVAEARER